MDIDPTTATIALARRVVSLPCYLCVFVEPDTTNVVLELRDLHGRATGIQGAGRTYFTALAVVRANLEARGEPVGAVCIESTKMCEQLEKSIDRARQMRGLPPIAFGDFPSRGR